MTKLLDIALTKAGKLPEAEPDRTARLVLDETLDEARWQATAARRTPLAAPQPQARSKPRISS